MAGDGVDIREDYGSDGARGSRVDEDGVGIVLDGVDNMGIEIEVEDDYDDEDYTRDEEETVDEHRVWFWQDKQQHTDQYVLRWETDLLVELGKSVQVIHCVMS